MSGGTSAAVGLLPLPCESIVLCHEPIPIESFRIAVYAGNTLPIGSIVFFCTIEILAGDIQRKAAAPCPGPLSLAPNTHMYVGHHGSSFVVVLQIDRDCFFDQFKLLSDIPTRESTYSELFAELMLAGFVGC